MDEMALKEERLRWVSTIEIIAKIENGEPVEYDHRIINKDINIHEINLQKDNERYIINSAIKMTFCIFYCDINLSDAIFTKQVIFSESIFRGKALFANSIFNEILPEDRDQVVLNSNYNRSQLKKNSSLVLPKFDGNINFNGAKFDEIADFNGCKFLDYAFFNLCKFKNFAKFDDSSFSKYCYFRISEFSLNALFYRCKFKDRVAFYNSRFYGDAFFVGDVASSATNFNQSFFCGDAIFNFSIFNSLLSFEFCQFGGILDFHEYKHKGEVLSFKHAIFRDPLSQEEACRRAKNVLERGGNREDAGYHFYREMEARRIQKPWYYRYPEFALIQLIFGYGVHPWRLMGWWIASILCFALIYYIGVGVIDATQLFDSIKFSFATAIAPGYIATIVNSQNSTGYNLAPMYQSVAMIETVFGTFMWAAFIATFARKYMR